MRFDPERMKYIDMATYPRLSHYEHFRRLAFPYVGVTDHVDVTGLVNAAKQRGGSTFLACLYAAARSANAVAAMRQRIEGDRILELNHCDTGHTVAVDDGTFTNCRTDCRMSFDEFLVKAGELNEQAKQRRGFVNPDEDENDLIFVSCTPWLHFTQVIQPAPIPADCIPRIVFGKYVKQDGKIIMPLSIQCNHALVDGRHLGEFYENFASINEIFL